MTPTRPVLRASDRSGADKAPTRGGRTLLHLLFIVLCYAAFMSVVFTSVDATLGHDNNRHYLNYRYFADSLRLLGGFPRWYYTNGGLPVGATSLNFGPFLPHRLLGYLLYAILPLSTLTLYKITLLAGMSIVGTGWWLVLFRLTGSRAGATFGALILLLGGSGITVLHAEQALFTMTWAPWFVLALLKVKEDFRFIVAAAALLGLSVTTHYPQIHIIAFLALTAALVLTGRIDRDLLREGARRRKTLAAAALVFVLAASPAFYLYKIKDDFSSPLRAASDLEVSTIEDYRKLNELMPLSSISWEYMGNYLKPETDALDDQFAFFITFAGLVLVAIGLAARFGEAAPALIVFLLCSWAAFGTHGYFAQLMFLLKLPFISLFRQWYFFVHLMNLALSVMVALGVAAILHLPHRSGLRGRTRALTKAGIVIILFSAVFFDASRYQHAYFGSFFRPMENTSEQRPTREEFLTGLSSGAYRHDTWSPLLVYKQWFKLSRLCPAAVATDPFTTNTVALSADAVIDGSNMSVSEGEFKLMELCRAGLLNYLVTMNQGPSVPSLPSMPSLVDNVIPFGGDREALLTRIAALEMKAFPLAGLSVTPGGVGLTGESRRGFLIIFPYSYEMNFRAYLKGMRVETLPVYDGAMTGLIVPGGRYDLELSVPFTGFHLGLALQMAILAGAILFALLHGRSVSRPEEGGDAETGG